jgi:DNA-binding response OmpR family regulator
MNRFRVLLLGDRDRLPRNLADRIYDDSEREMAAEAVEAVHTALARLSRQGYDAAVCWADRTDELAGVIRIRKANPDLPILVLTSPTEDAGFDDLSSRAGANRTAHVARDPGILSECIRRTIESGELHRELLRQARRVLTNAVDVQALSERNRSLVKTARKLARERSTARMPILVEDQPDEAQLLVRAFQAAGMAAPPTVFATAEKAIAFLSDEGSYRELDPVQPFSFALLDVRLPGMSGLDLLEWMGRTPKLVHVPVVMLSGSSDPEQIHRAFRLGAKSYLIKPVGFDPLVRLVEGVHRFWTLSEAGTGD